MFFSFEQIIPWLVRYKYFAIFPLAFFEGPIITIIAGFLASLGYINFLTAYLVIVVADEASDLMYFWIGEKGGRKFINRWGHYLGIAQKQAVSLEKYFGRHGGKMLFLGKLLHGIGTVFLVAAGLAKMPFSKFIFYNSLATLLKSIILITIGFYFGQAFMAINAYLEKITLVFIGGAVLFGLIYFFHLRKTVLIKK
ncbi:DedA family protein [Patescibacteria group bacterium]|nr:DedA family protein [Patescibacteria group bacterium]